MRRLMPEYKTGLNKEKEKVIKYKASMRELDHIEDCFRKIAPGLSACSRDRHHSNRRYNFKMHPKGHHNAQLELSSYGGAHCDLALSDLSIETTIKIIALLCDSKT